MITTRRTNSSSFIPFSQAAAPPRISSTSFRSGLFVLVKLCLISQEKGHVEHMNIEFEDADADSKLAGVCIWRSVPSKGQNHMISGVPCERVVVP